MNRTPRQTQNNLDPAHIVTTIKQLSKRIQERFPDAKLVLTCNELLRLSQKTRLRIIWIGRPIIWIRIATAIVITLLAAGLIVVFSQFNLTSQEFDVLQLTSLMNAGMNNVVLLAALTFFLITIESRVKRKRALLAIHELRSLAHMIDMHQLTKDPDRVLFQGGSTQSSPTSDMDVFEMSRYLDYCGEMLSLIGKIAAIYSLHWQDEVAVNAVNEIEHLTAGLSQKIFQKIMILHGTQTVTQLASVQAESDQHGATLPE